MKFLTILFLLTVIPITYVKACTSDQVMASMYYNDDVYVIKPSKSKPNKKSEILANYYNEFCPTVQNTNQLTKRKNK